MSAIGRRTGETLEIIVTVEAPSGGLIDLTGYPLECQIRDKATGSLLHEMAIDRDNEADGYVRFVAGPEVTGFWTPNTYEVNVALSSPAAHRRSADIKDLVIRREVTRYVG